MTSLDFIHPEDSAALDALKAIPALPSLMDKIFQYGYDEISWSENVVTNVRLSEEQMPEIYQHLPPICKKLGIPVPELYLQMSPIANAWTSGHKRVYIVVTLGLISRFKGEELDAVLAHECGHILCEHVLYHTLANAVFTMGDVLMESFIGTLGNTAMMPIKQSLLSWYRAAELSADRVACMVTSALTLTKVLAKLSGIPGYVIDNMNYKEWARQGADYENLKKGTVWNKVARGLLNRDIDHPYFPVRAFEAFKWEESLSCAKLKSGIKMIAGGLNCPSCNALISSEWAFCRNCGYKLK